MKIYVSLVFITIFEICQILSDEKSKLSVFEIVLRGTVIALIISIPSLTSFVLIWVLFDDLVLGIIVGVVTHFIAMGFSLKISKKLLLR